MLVQLYSLRRLPEELRSTFELPDDPYGELHEAADEYLRPYYIFWYRDEEYTDACIIEPPEDTRGMEGLRSIRQREGFTAFKSLCEIDPDLFKILEWEAGNEEEKQRRIEVLGDNFKWLLWNEPRRVRKLSPQTIYVS